MDNVNVFGDASTNRLFINGNNYFFVCSCTAPCVSIMADYVWH